MWPFCTPPVALLTTPDCATQHGPGLARRMELFSRFSSIFSSIKRWSRWASGPPLQERQLALHRRTPITSRSLMVQSNMTTWRIVLQVGDGKHTTRKLVGGVGIGDISTSGCKGPPGRLL